MSDIASAIDKMNTDEVGQDKPITEALNTKIGANINGLIDEVITGDLGNRVTDLETRMDETVDTTIYTSPWLYPANISFSRVIEPSRTRLFIDSNGFYNIGDFNDISPSADIIQNHFILQNPYATTGQDDGDVSDDNDIVYLEFNKTDAGGLSGNWQVRYKIRNFVRI